MSATHHEPLLSGTKVCNECRRELSVICYSVDSKRTDGLWGKCRECFNRNQHADYVPKMSNLGSSRRWLSSERKVAELTRWGATP